MTIDELKELMETGEEFELYCSDDYIRRFNRKINVFERLVNGNWYQSSISINMLLTYNVLRKPWKPKVGEIYWFWTLDMWSKCEVFSVDFDSECDMLRFAFGNCFRTKEECESHTEIRDKLIEMRKEYA